MADIEAQAEARVIDARSDLHEHVRLRLHHVFQRKAEAVRGGLPKFPPEFDGPGREPLREIDERDIAAVHHDAPDAERQRRLHGLSKAQHDDLAHARVDGAGRQLRKRRMQPERADPAAARPRSLHGRRFFQFPRLAEIRQLQPKAPFPGQRSRIFIHPGEKQLSA